MSNLSSHLNIFGFRLKSIKILNPESIKPYIIEEQRKTNNQNHIKFINSLIDTPNEKINYAIVYLAWPQSENQPLGKIEIYFICHYPHNPKSKPDEISILQTSLLKILESIFDEYTFQQVPPDEVRKKLSAAFFKYKYFITRRVIIDQLDTLTTGITRRMGFVPQRDQLGPAQSEQEKYALKDNEIFYIFPFSNPNYKTEQFFSLLQYQPAPFINENVQQRKKSTKSRKSSIRARIPILSNFLKGSSEETSESESPIAICIKMIPTTLTREEEELIEEQITKCEKFAQIYLTPSEDIKPLKPTFQELARAYQRNLIKFLFALKNSSALLVFQILANHKLPVVYLNSIASFITSPAENSKEHSIESYLSGGYEIFEVNPSSKINLLDEICDSDINNLPDHPLVPHQYKRLLHMFDSDSASLVFKFPVQPTNVIPSFEIQLYEEIHAPTELIELTLSPSTKDKIKESSCLIGKNLFKSASFPIRIYNEDRKRHIYVIGQTGTGKTTLLKTMILDDLRSGRGLCVIDPHGDLFKELLGKIPENRLNDVIIFDPTDTDYPIGFNVFEYKDPDSRYFIVQEFIGIIKRLLEGEYGKSAAEFTGPIFYLHVRMNTLLIMSDPEKPGTIVDLYNIFQDNHYWRRWENPKISDPLLKRWVENILPEVDYITHGVDKISLGDYIASKFQNFVFDPYLRNIFGQRKSTFNLTDIMNEGKVLLVNLAKGELTEENSRFLGMLIMIKLMTSAMERVKIPEEKRKEFYIYVDEFQNIATNSFSILVSEARKFGVSLILANQFIEQITDKVITEAIFGNVGTIICFRLGLGDAQKLKGQFYPFINEFHLMNLPNWNAYVLSQYKGQKLIPFNIITIPDDTPYDPQIAHRVKELSRQRYGRPKIEVEKEVNEEI